MKATQLDTILRDYENTDEKKALMSDSITKKKLVIKLLIFFYIH